MNGALTPRSTTLMRIGGISALVWVALQVVGNILHPRLPEDPVGAMTHIGHSGVWFIAHVILLFDYVVLIPMIVGFAASFGERSWTIKLCVPLMVVAVAVGIVQVALHPTTLRILSEQYMMAHDDMGRSSVITLFEGFWRFNIVLEIGHLLVIHTIVLLVAIAMFSEPLYPRWLGWLGVAGGVIAAASLIIGEVFLDSSVLGDLLTFGVGILPSAVWLVAVGVVLIRATKKTSLPATEGGLL